MQEWLIPLKLVSEGNINEHWTVRAKRHKTICRYLWAAFKQQKPDVQLPCRITLTRIAPRRLDQEDNLPYAFKHVKDFVADALIPGQAKGRADGDPRLSWVYEQKKGKPKYYAIEIKIEPVT